MLKKKTKQKKQPQFGLPDQNSGYRHRRRRRRRCGKRRRCGCSCRRNAAESTAGANRWAETRGSVWEPGSPAMFQYIPVSSLAKNPESKNPDRMSKNPARNESQGKENKPRWWTRTEWRIEWGSSYLPGMWPGPAPSSHRFYRWVQDIWSWPRRTWRIPWSGPRSSWLIGSSCRVCARSRPECRTDPFRPTWWNVRSLWIEWGLQLVKLYARTKISSIAADWDWGKYACGSRCYRERCPATHHSPHRPVGKLLETQSHHPSATMPGVLTI